MKYNLKEIMKRAWVLVKKYGKTKSEALKLSWGIEKVIKQDKENSGYPDGRVELNFWFCYGKERAYLTRSYVSNYQNKRGHYIDLKMQNLKICL